MTIGKRTLLVFLALLPTLSQAEDWQDWPLAAKLRISAGALLSKLDTEAGVTQKSPFVQGDLINFENDLGLADDDNAAYIAVDWRPFKRHALSLYYFELNRSATATTPRDLTFDGVTFPQGIESDTTLDLAVYEVAYSYSVIFDETKNIYLGFGVATQDYDFDIAATAFPALRVQEDFIAPLPTINLGFDYVLAENWTVHARGGYLGVDVSLGDDDFDADIRVLNVGTRWQPGDHLGIGFYYSLLEVDGDFEDDDIIAAVDIEYKGPRIGLDYAF